ncbi:MAG: hypothetical protein QXU40_02300 [Candidatus Pacearchaeota archaeon]
MESAGSLSSLRGNDLRSVLNDLISLLDDPQFLRSLNQLGINISGGKANKNFLNIVPALLGNLFGVFNQPSQFVPSFDPIASAINTEKQIALGEVDRSVGEQIGAGTSELYNRGLGPLAIADFAAQTKSKSSALKGDIGQKFAAQKQRAKFDFDQAVAQLKQQYDLMKRGNVNQSIADIGQLLSLFLL